MRAVALLGLPVALALHAHLPALPRAAPAPFVASPAKLASPRATILAMSEASAAHPPDACEAEALDEAGCPAPTNMERVKAVTTGFCNLFPVWIIATALTGLFAPSTFACVSTKYFTALIGVLMLCMGITLKPSDFARVSTRPGAVLLAFAGCYGLMPLLALLLSRALSLPSSLTAGMILLSSINGAQASNLCTYIGKGDVALSVLMTTMTTVGAIIMTPLVAKLLLGAVVPVNAKAIVLSTMQVVLVPIGGGMLINAKFPKAVQAVLPFSPVVGVLSTCALVGASVGGTAGPILAAGLRLQAACAALHMLGGAIAYFGTRALKYSERTCRTFGIEIAMKSSAFGYLLASLHFAADPLVRVPSAVSIVWMSAIGASLAVASRFNPVPDDE